MAPERSRWFASLREGRWKSALSAAPALVERGRKLFSRAAAHDPEETLPGARLPVPAADDPLARVEARLGVLAERAARLEQDAGASYELVRGIAEQHAQLAEQQARLVEALDRLLARTRLLVWTTCALAIFALGLAAAVAVAIW